MSDLVQDLADFVVAAPTPYHAVAEAARRLSAAIELNPRFNPLYGPRARRALRGLR